MCTAGDAEGGGGGGGSDGRPGNGTIRISSAVVLTRVGFPICISCISFVLPDLVLRVASFSFKPLNSFRTKVEVHCGELEALLAWR